MHRGAAPRVRALGHGEPALRQVLREGPQPPGPAACPLGANGPWFAGRDRGSVAGAFGRARGGGAPPPNRLRDVRAHPSTEGPSDAPPPSTAIRRRLGEVVEDATWGRASRVEGEFRLEGSQPTPRR